MTIEIRAAAVEESAILQRLARASKAHWGYSARYMKLWNFDRTITPEFVEAHPTFCAVSTSQIQGFYALTDEDGFKKLKHMWVHPQHLGAGVSEKLLHHALSLVGRLGAPRMKVVAEPHAEGFYRRMGGRRIAKKYSLRLGQEFPILMFDAPRPAASPHSGFMNNRIG